MQKYLALLCLLVLGACSTFQASTVSTVKAQQAVDFAQAAYKAGLRAELLYLNQKPCGLTGSSPPPFCASYAVGVKWKALDEKLKKAIVDLQDKINTLGTDPKVLDAAVAAVQFALAELESFSASNGVK
jgi:hypothetical protein